MKGIAEKGKQCDMRGLLRTTINIFHLGSLNFELQESVGQKRIHKIYIFLVSTKNFKTSYSIIYI